MSEYIFQHVRRMKINLLSGNKNAADRNRRFPIMLGTKTYSANFAEEKARVPVFQRCICCKGKEMTYLGKGNINKTCISIHIK